eukprot:8709925-Prorocentrum_lima.AAC.1
MTSSLVGSEMCIRDRTDKQRQTDRQLGHHHSSGNIPFTPMRAHLLEEAVSYTHLTLPTICSV